MRSSKRIVDYARIAVDSPLKVRRPRTHAWGTRHAVPFLARHVPQETADSGSKESAGSSSAVCSPQCHAGRSVVGSAILISASCRAWQALYGSPQLVQFVQQVILVCDHPRGNTPLPLTATRDSPRPCWYSITEYQQGINRVSTGIAQQGYSTGIAPLPLPSLHR